MRKKAGITALILCSVTLLGGCSLGINDQSLLSPPKITGREAELENLISQTANGSYKLKYPQSGEFRSAIITKDLNSDGKDEAIAFYRGSDSDAVNMLVMYDAGKQWETSKNFELKFSDVDCVKFSDYDFDGTEEIFAGLKNSNENICELNVFDYTPSDHQLEHIDFDAAYSAFSVGDYDRDGGSEVLTFNLDSSENDASATLYDYDKNKLYALDNSDMDQKVIRYENIVSGLINKDTVGVAVDGLTDDGYNSQIIYYNTSKRALLNYPVTAGKGRSTTHSDKVYSADIDQDGYIEIPIINESSAKSGSESETVAPVINWSGFNTKNNKLTTKVKCVTNFEFGYYFKLPESFSDTTITTLSDDKRTMKIYSKKSDSADKLIVTFRVFDVGANTDDMNGYSTLESYNQYTYTYKIENNPPISITGEKIKENFALNDSSV